MLLFVYRSFFTMILVLITVLIEMSAARGIVAFLGNAGIIGLSTYATNLLTLLVVAAGTDYAIFIVGRYQEARGAGEDRESAFYTMFRGNRPHRVGFGPDRCRRGSLPGLHPTSLLPEPGHTRRNRHPRRAFRRAQPGSGGAHPGCTGGPFRPETRDENPRMAADRHGHRAVARPRSCRGLRVGPGGSARAARLQDELRHPSLHACQRAGQRGLRGRGAALLPCPPGARIADDRNGSRHAQPGRHAHLGQGGQGGFSRPRHCPGADHHQAAGNPARPQLARVSNQHAKRHPAGKPDLPTRSRE